MLQVGQKAPEFKADAALGNDEFNRRKEIWGTVQYEIDKKGKVLYERGN